MNVKIDIREVVVESFRIPWRNCRAFARALMVPLLLLTGTSVLQYGSLDSGGGDFRWERELVLFAAYGILLVWITVTCHRLVLLDTPAVASRWIPPWSLREVRFLLWMAAIWVVLPFVTLGLFFAGAALWAPMATWTAMSGTGYMAVTTALMAPPLYLFARLCPIFPATAIDRKVGLRWAWGLTRGNGWRLFLVVGLLPWIASNWTDFLFREEATLLQSTGLTVAGSLLLIVEVVAVSVSYRQLTREPEVGGRHMLG